MDGYSTLSQVIMFNKSSFRAFCRRGVAHIHLEEFDKARYDHLTSLSVSACYDIILGGMM